MPAEFACVHTAPFVFKHHISIYVRPKIVQKFKRNLRYSLLAEQRKGLCIHT